MPKHIISNNIILAAKDLACKRNEQLLFKNVAFSLAPGAALQIIGQNGSGKTTLLRVVAGLAKPWRGVISSTGIMCYIGHQHNLHPALTVRQNLQFLLGMVNYHNSTSAHLLQLLGYFNLQYKINAKCSELSAGQQQRVSLARLSCCQAKIWLLDEPLANLDYAATELLEKLCARHLAAGGAVITATHKLLNFAALPTETLQLENYA